MGNKTSKLLTASLLLGTLTALGEATTMPMQGLVLPVEEDTGALEWSPPPPPVAETQKVLTWSTSPRLREIGHGLDTGDLYLEEVGTGINRSQKVFDLRRHSLTPVGYLKRAAFATASPQAEQNAYDLFTTLGLQMPETIVEGDRVFKATIRGRHYDGNYRNLAPSAMQDMQLMHLADVTFGNFDRHVDNYLLSEDGQHVIPLDNDSFEDFDNIGLTFRREQSHPDFPENTPILPQVIKKWQQLAASKDPRWKRAQVMADVLMTTDTINEVQQAYEKRVLERLASELYERRIEEARKRVRASPIESPLQSANSRYTPIRHSTLLQQAREYRLPDEFLARLDQMRKYQGEGDVV